MQLRQLFDDESAVSPVIGVILMVAITVILAAVIGAFVLNLGQGLGDSAPQASFDFDYEAPESGPPHNVTISHASGDSIPAEQLNASVSGTISFNYTQGNFSGEYAGESVGAGDSVTYELDSDTWDGQTVRVVWTSENGESSATLSQSTAPSS
jgi:flagellin-like protein